MKQLEGAFSFPSVCRRGWLSFLLLIVLSVTAPVEGQEFHTNKNWFVSVFGGVGTHNNIGQLLEADVDLADSYIAGVAVAREMYRYKHYMGLELEGQAIKHWNLQDHYEFNALFTLRWHPFPWDKYLNTSFAMGNGVSYATDEPEIEIIKNDETTRLLYYFFFELDFQLPETDTWSVFARLHHRSGAFGLFDGIEGGSNFFAGGVRYRF